MVFGDLAPRVAALIRARPILIARLIVAPREAVHAIAAFLHLAPDAAGPDVDVAKIINQTDPRELLNAALPACPARLYRALDRAGDRVRERRFYEKLAAVCSGPFADRLLDGALDDIRVAHFEALSRMDPALGAMRSALPENTYLVEGIDSLVAFLRARGALRDGDLRLPPGAGLPAITRRLRVALGRIEAPDPGFNPPPPFRLLRTSDELQRIGKAFGNCVALPQWGSAQHHFHLLDGTGVYLASDEPPLLVSLRRAADRVWYFDQAAGPGNETPPAGMKAGLFRDLRATGLTIVTADPQSSLARLEQETRRSRRAGGVEVDLGGEGDGQDDDEIAERVA
ncbi:hypothetical protein ACFQU2_16655 [Siccirubricoccus deserti]|uniref:Uncharacterized protein n=1 Tax=Siccirubricoccus deserti TaxID=2013562 RepID=A0A9X0UFD4_9PROT|nr:hypothetical protein [Siccirubricoccus deserti]MBC4018642.1 hypothetical protein [Siccirubricoccus deserti]